ncbi:hypothetical protein [Bosea sp. CRIB-10]|uniref:hypothetical protein n=1 Tax=Bosea sp. CRIB-10 TaxID=378404 RepID=UPI000B823061|nr:hypothetical protein [Bosea sp. CRIB-10]
MTGVRRFVLDRRLVEADEPRLDATELDHLARIVDGEELGASRHAQLAQAVLVHGAGGSSARRAMIVDFIASTRGAEAPIVDFAMNWLLEPGETSQPALAARAAGWTTMIASLRTALVDAAVSHLRHARVLVLFDYSGTVADVVAGLAASGRRPALIIPESRAIAGGRRYLERLAPLALPTRFVFDAALDGELVGVDALLLGAESLSPDGGLVNTLGSRGAARLAQAHGVPVLGCAELIKRDRTPGKRLPEPRDFSATLLAGLDADWAIDCRQAELEHVPPGLISLHLTERGPMRPAMLTSFP